MTVTNDKGETYNEVGHTISFMSPYHIIGRELKLECTSGWAYVLLI